jgi:hypothetical protein
MGKRKRRAQMRATLLEVRAKLHEALVLARRWERG